MNAKKEGNRTTVERRSERELVVTRTFNAPARIVFEAWTSLELFKRWWVPRSCGVSFLSCEADVRTGGTYRFVFGHAASEQPMAFFGRYIEVTPHVRLVWTNDEGGEGGAVTTVTFEERGGETLVVMHDLYPSKEALDAAIASGSTGGFSETFEQLDALLVTLGASVGGHEVADLAVGLPGSSRSGRRIYSGSTQCFQLLRIASHSSTLTPSTTSREDLVVAMRTLNAIVAIVGTSHSSVPGAQDYAIDARLLDGPAAHGTGLHC